MSWYFMLNNIIPDYTPLNRSHIASISISITNMHTIDLSGIIIRNVEVLNVIVLNCFFFFFLEHCNGEPYTWKWQ